MSLKHTRSLFLVALFLLGQTGCAIYAAMSKINDHYQAAQSYAQKKAYADADTEVGKVETIFASDDVVKESDSPRFAELHAQLTTQLGDLRAKLKAGDAEQVMPAFKTASATCEACHNEF